MSDDALKQRIAAMTRKELNSHAYHFEKEQEEYAIELAKLKAITELKIAEIAELKAEMVSIGKVAAIGLKKNDPYDMKISLQAIEMAVDHEQT